MIFHLCCEKRQTEKLGNGVPFLIGLAIGFAAVIVLREQLLGLLHVEVDLPIAAQQARRGNFSQKCENIARGISQKQSNFMRKAVCLPQTAAL